MAHGREHTAQALRDSGATEVACCTTFAITGEAPSAPHSGDAPGPEVCKALFVCNSSTYEISGMLGRYARRLGFAPVFLGLHQKESRGWA